MGVSPMSLIERSNWPDRSRWCQDLAVRDMLLIERFDW